LVLGFYGRDPAPSMHAIMALDMPSPAVGYTSYRPGERNTPHEKRCRLSATSRVGKSRKHRRWR